MGRHRAQSDHLLHVAPDGIALESGAPLSTVCLIDAPRGPFDHQQLGVVEYNSSDGSPVLVANPLPEMPVRAQPLL